MSPRFNHKNYSILVANEIETKADLQVGMISVEDRNWTYLSYWIEKYQLSDKV
jgi:hypothetical protein